ncbi:hypothetical protein G7Z17_g4614 [Cylindrodendrum hubeiense]|uniref:Isochorismatase hydrolase n=1 Tax=Cylindrodendrum hubeiense TaxID=595255 RepID=A0A9P5LIR1_9HYPO|nr:hypothetical protein G7Z17_g4614 [Cylindrodendrum hubeiense]
MVAAPITSRLLSVDAQPYAFAFDPAHTALLVIDMQRDFLLAGGFGDIQGGNLDAVQASIAPTKKLLEACRDAGLKIFHTREGHKPDLSDCPSSKLVRQSAAPQNAHHTLVIGDKGEMGRLLIRGEYGHDIIDELQPLPGEVVIDKPGKGAFWNTTLMHQLKSYDVTHLIVSGVTTECCFASTIREANDRGFECWGSPNSPPQTPPDWDGDLRIESLQRSYKAGVSPMTVVEALYRKIEAYKEVDPAVWIELITKDTALQAAEALVQQYPDRTKLPPLFGVPFSIKDSLDVAGLPTTTACPPLTHIPSKSAVVHDKALANGAIFVGKTNLDQLATGGILTPIDWSPFDKAGRLLYEGTFVSERLASLPDDWLLGNRAHLHPVIVELFDRVVQKNSSAVQAYRDLQAKARHTREAEKVFTTVDFVLVPTTTTHWTVEEMLADPIRKNSMLGEFTHAGNVLDLCAVAVPITTYPASELSGKTDDARKLPFGVTLLGGSRLDAEILRLARIVEEGAASANGSVSYSFP